MSYNCKQNIERDRNVYKINPAFWATRPMTKYMIDWASGDVFSLFDLRIKQLEYNSTSAVKRKCVQASIKSSVIWQYEAKVSIHVC